MPHPLYPVPEPLLRHLGTAQSEPSLREALEPYKPSEKGLFRPQSPEPYAVATGQPGLSLMVQCIDPAQPPEKRLWGLHALSFQTRNASERDHWAGPWPQGLEPERAQAQELTEVLTAPEADEAQGKTARLQGIAPAQVHLNMPNLCSVEVPGYGQQRWMVQGIFDFGSYKLTHLMVLRMGDWSQPAPQDITENKA